ncbi:MAG: TRAP transporter large permease [Synergistales bacterium]
MDIGVLFGILFVLLALSVPIGISLGVATAVTIFTFSHLPLVLIAQNAFTGMDSFPLLAIPFFMLAGSLMTYGGISRRIVAMAECLVGFITGGLAMVTIVACMFFGAISGSAAATVSAIGSFMVPMMVEKKYNPAFAAAVISSAGTIGCIIPPSIPFVVYGVITGTSVSDLFIAGIVPGIVIGIALMVVAFFISKKEQYPRMSSFPTFKMVLKVFGESIWALLVPVIVLGGIYGGIFTPTEAAVVATVYALVVGKFIYKELTYEITLKAFKDAIMVIGATLFMVGLATSFASYLSMERVPVRVGSFILGFAHSKFLVLLLINAVLLIIGCFVDNISSTIILTPIFLPIVTALGMDPIQFGMIISIGLAIGFSTPPYGCNLFISSTISKVSVEKISSRLVPFILAMICCQLLFTYFPWFSLFLLNK